MTEATLLVLAGVPVSPSCNGGEEGLGDKQNLESWGLCRVTRGRECEAGPKSPVRPTAGQARGEKIQGRALLVWAAACLGPERQLGTLSMGGWQPAPAGGGPVALSGWPRQPEVWGHSSKFLCLTFGGEETGAPRVLCQCVCVQLVTVCARQKRSMCLAGGVGEGGGHGGWGSAPAAEENIYP